MIKILMILILIIAVIGYYSNSTLCTISLFPYNILLIVQYTHGKNRTFLF